jgi:hypothetical protein
VIPLQGSGEFRRFAGRTPCFNHGGTQEES